MRLQNTSFPKSLSGVNEGLSNKGEDEPFFGDAEVLIGEEEEEEVFLEGEDEDFLGEKEELFFCGDDDEELFLGDEVELFFGDPLLLFAPSKPILASSCLRSFLLVKINYKVIVYTLYHTYSYSINLQDIIFTSKYLNISYSL